MSEVPLYAARIPVETPSQELRPWSWTPYQAPVGQHSGSIRPHIRTPKLQKLILTTCTGLPRS